MTRKYRPDPRACPHGHLARSCEICELTAALAAAEARIGELSLALSDAAKEINCSGPVAHRIRILRQEKDQHIADLEKQLADAVKALRKIAAVVLANLETKP